MSKKKRGRNAPRLRVPDIPDSVFEPLVKRLDRLMEYHREKWPDGVNPDKTIHPIAKEIGPAARAYKAGIRAKSLYAKMQEIAAWLNDGIKQEELEL